MKHGEVDRRHKAEDGGCGELRLGATRSGGSRLGRVDGEAAAAIKEIGCDNKELNSVPVVARSGSGFEEEQRRRRSVGLRRVRTTSPDKARVRVWRRRRIWKKGSDPAGLRHRNGGVKNKEGVFSIYRCGGVNMAISIERRRSAGVRSVKMDGRDGRS